MPQSPQEQRAIVQRMIDAGESEQNIATVIQHFKAVSPPPPPRSGMETARDVALGVGKSALGLVEGGGKLLRSIPGVDRASRALGEVTLPVTTTPTNTAQAVGKAAGDIGQFFVPALGTTKLAQVVKNVGLTAMQGGGLGSSLASGAITAALPGAGAAGRAAVSARAGAEKSMAQALGATTDKMKAQAAKLAPEMLERGVAGSRTAMLKQATAELDTAGKQIGAEVARAKQAGEAISGATVRDGINRSINTLHEVDASGRKIVIAGLEPVVKQLEKLDAFIGRMGSSLWRDQSIPIEKAQRIKTAWDKIVAKAGLFGPKASATASDQAKAWAYREASGSLRSVMAKANPTLDDINKEYAFWKGMKDVLSKTELRTQAQGPGLTATLAGGAGAVIGVGAGHGAAGAGVGAMAGALIGQQTIKLMQSPYWKTTVSGPLKNMLADALASGTAERVTSATRAIVASLPSQVRQQLGEK